MLVTLIWGLHLQIAGVTVAIAASALLENLLPTGHRHEVTAVLNRISVLPCPYLRLGTALFFAHCDVPASVAMGSVLHLCRLHRLQQDWLRECVLPTTATLAGSIASAATILRAVSQFPEYASGVVFALSVGACKIAYDAGFWAARWWEDWHDSGLSRLIKSAARRMTKAAPSTPAGTAVTPRRAVPEPHHHSIAPRPAPKTTTGRQWASKGHSGATRTNTASPPTLSPVSSL